MGERIKTYAISIELLQEIMTKGWQAGADSIIRCVEGLPQGAQFEYTYAGEDRAITMVFSHPDWPEIGPLQSVPRELARYERVAEHGRMGVSTEGAAWALDEAAK